MKNKQKFIISIALTISINLIVIISWWFAYSGIRQERDIIVALRREIDVNERKLSNSRSLGVLLADIKKDEEKIASTFLNSKNIVKFIENLEFLSRNTGVTLNVSAIDIPVIEDSVKESTFRFKIMGTFNELFQYFVLFENLPYQIEIEKMSLLRPQIPNLGEIANTKTSRSIWEAEFDVKLLSYENS